MEYPEADCIADSRQSEVEKWKYYRAVHARFDVRAYLSGPEHKRVFEAAYGGRETANLQSFKCTHMGCEAEYWWDAGALPAACPICRRLTLWIATLRAPPGVDPDAIAEAVGAFKL
jgi:hypothetical protein